MSRGEIYELHINYYIEKNYLCVYLACVTLFYGIMYSACTCIYISTYVVLLKPPRIGGVKVYTENVRRDEIYMDLDIM